MADSREDPLARIRSDWNQQLARFGMSSLSPPGEHGVRDEHDLAGLGARLAQVPGPDAHEPLERFEAALADDPTLGPTLDAIEALAHELEDWPALERSYRRVLGHPATNGSPEHQRAIWTKLAELYRTRLGDARSLAIALDVLTRLDPEDMERHVELAGLCDRLRVDDPHAWADAAVREHRILLAHEPLRVESYHALFDSYSGAQQVDPARCVASVLEFLEKATPEEEAYLEQHREDGLRMARRRLSEEALRKHVAHPDLDPYLTGVMGLIAPAIAAWRVVDLPATLDVRERIDIEVDPSLLSRMAKYVKDVLGVVQPDVFLRLDDEGDLALLNVKRDGQLHPALVVFRNLLLGKTEEHLAFALGRYLSDLYLPCFGFVALDRSPQALKQVLLACLHGVGAPVEGDIYALDLIGREIFARMQPAARDRTRSLLLKLIEAGDSIDVVRWVAASELTACRVGLLLCGDLRTAGQMISQEAPPLGMGTVSPRDKLEDLMLYSISEDYFAARRALGLDG